MEKRKTIGGEDILYAMGTLGFENYAETLKIHLAKLRQVRGYVFFVGAAKVTDSHQYQNGGSGSSGASGAGAGGGGGAGSSSGRERNEAKDDE